MVKLNLEAKTKPQELILAYLEKNATETLVEKINNGVSIEKDGKALINKKTLDGFMKYAETEARKLAEKGANSACVEDTIVYGWAMHYFEEDSVEGTLYNLDGTEYKQPNKGTQKTVKPKTVTTAKKEKTTAQYSLFDMITAEEEKPKEPEKPTLDEILDYNIDDNHDDDEDEETSEEMQQALKHIEAEKQAKEVKPFYQQYLDLQKEYPSSVVLMRLGDFYEVFGGNAIQLADELNMTLASRDVGLPERIPMIGFPFHAADVYFLKIHANHDMLVCEKNDDTTFLPAKEKKDEPEKHWIDDTTYVDDDGLIHEVTKPIPEWILKAFSNKVIAR